MTSRSARSIRHSILLQSPTVQVGARGLAGAETFAGAMWTWAERVIGLLQDDSALGWVAVHEPVTVLGTPSRAGLEACWDLGATTAATLMPT